MLIDERTVTLKTVIEPSELNGVVQNTGDMVRVKVEWNASEWDLATVYAPARAGPRVAFARGLASRLSKMSIVGGDWNCVPDVVLDASGPDALNYANVGAAVMEDALSEVELYDVRREQLGQAKEATRIGKHLTTRLDRWYVPLDESLDHVLYTVHTRSDWVFKDSELDHKAVLLTIETPDGEAGHERHQIREDLLMEPLVQSAVLRLAQEAYAKGGSEGAKWERAHAAMRDYLLKETAKRRAKERVEIRIARAKLKGIDATIKRKGPNENLRRARGNLQKELFALEQPESTPIHEEAQAMRCAERSDKSTKHFFSSYKAIAKQQWINKIARADWKEDEEPTFNGHTATPKEVPFELMKFYKMLFAEKKINKAKEKKILTRLEKRKILTASRDRLEQPITRKEIAQVMEDLPLGKQAGPDRIPNAVYKNLSVFFSEKLEAVLDESITNGRLPTTFLNGDIGLLYKKDERDDPRHYRPITLLQNAYKIYTRVLTRRMRDVVHEFVSETQKGFVPKAFIADCTMLLNLIESYINADEDNRGGIFLFLDMEKAFDRCSYEYLIDALRALGFGPRFIQSVGLMYNIDNPPKRRIYANGYYSDWFPIKSGVAQVFGWDHRIWVRPPSVFG